MTTLKTAINYGKLMLYIHKRRIQLRVLFNSFIQDPDTSVYMVEEAKKALLGLDHLTPNRARAIQIILGQPIPTPTTPTAPATDNTANTFDWTNTPGYTLVSDYEQTTNSGVTYIPLTAKPITGLTGVHAIGSVGVRVKAKTPKGPSATLFNAVAFS